MQIEAKFMWKSLQCSHVGYHNSVASTEPAQMYGTQILQAFIMQQD